MSSLLSCCFRVLRWLPVIFIAAVVSWSYYAYVIQLIVGAVPEEQLGVKVLLGLLYHPLLFMFAWSYYRIIFEEPGGLPRAFYLKEDHLRKLEEFQISGGEQEKENELLESFVQELNIPLQCRTFRQGVRYCEKCRAIKPDRAHHCSVCGKCVLKMDHHCPWVNNCVNHSNYKFFILFLFYAELYCIFVALSDLNYFIRFWVNNCVGYRNYKFFLIFLIYTYMYCIFSAVCSHHHFFLAYFPDRSGLSKTTPINFHVMFLFIVSVMFAISVMGLLGYHLYLVLRNQSTIESFRAPVFRHSGPDKFGFNIGKRGNFREVFGDNPRYWFLPIFTAKGDGVDFPTRTSMRAHNYSTMENGGNFVVNGDYY